MNVQDLRDLSPREDRRIGAVLGLAVGDALGATYEFCTPDEVPDGPLEMVGGGWLDLRSGETTDDTALAKAVLRGYREGPLDMRRVRDEMLRWEDSDPPDIGGQTQTALNYLRSNPEAIYQPEAPRAQGNGAVMRAASHGVMAQSPEAALDNAWAEAALTHPSENARVSSALVAGIIARLIEGQMPIEAVEVSFATLQDRELTSVDPREVFSPEIGDALEAYPEDRDRWGWTVYTTRLALGFLLRASDFRPGVEEVIKLGGDADTNGAVAGALLGARFGVSKIPSSWLESLDDTEEILGLI